MVRFPLICDALQPGLPFIRAEPPVEVLAAVQGEGDHVVVGDAVDGRHQFRPQEAGERGELRKHLIARAGELVGAFQRHVLGHDHRHRFVRLHGFDDDLFPDRTDEQRLGLVQQFGPLGRRQPRLELLDRAESEDGHPLVGMDVVGRLQVRTREAGEPARERVDPRCPAYERALRALPDTPRVHDADGAAHTAERPDQRSRILGVLADIG
jgi:hypothetical protein